ncbi:hypothetical protein KRX57_03100 [Weeksellaceae bacterium TAE3-ERU29]|nr:hypothetical protein [Weeksellaceae bacterium TAE3-ERU29]
MRNQIKKITLALLIIVGIGCKAQTVISLTDYEKCLTERINEPTKQCLRDSDNTYLKDVDHRLDSFVGTWTGKYQNKTFKLQLIKKIKFGKETPKADRLIGKMKITISGKEVLNTFNLPEYKAIPYGFNFESGGYVMMFDGGDCQDFGDIYLRIDPKNPNKVRMAYAKYIGFCRDKENYDYLIPTVILTREK